MKRKSSNLSYLKRALWHRARESKDPKQKADYYHLHNAAQASEEEINAMIRDAEMQGIRNPAFPDDLVGWLDDDFTLPDEPSTKPKDEDDEKP